MYSPDHRKDWESVEDPKEHRVCGWCCAWTSLLIGCVVFALVVATALFASFLQGSMPEFRIKQMNISHFQLVTRGDQTLLNSKLDLILNATNNNNKYDFSYGTLSVRVSTTGVDLGRAKIAPFKQPRRHASVLNMTTTVQKADINEEDGEDFKSDYKTRQVVISVWLTGHIGIDYNTMKFSKLPLNVYCNSINQMAIDSGIQPKCRVKMFAFL
ncbi:uncharacterized protein LOC127796944 [Diospyros lotus]|uniref:uncharacterized protein LOC127796944 n=1 Tax=Diospyros lotus TaxID=55363 RepID=UPI00225B3B59|nr:uncharacterized protein LOC127796944 [Diospyros lotus]